MTRRMVLWVVLVAVGCGPAQAPAPCGEGTVERSGVCVGAAQVRCGAGTELSGDSCLALAPVDGLRCGANTTLQGNSCEGTSSVTCGAGTAQSGAECVPAAAALSCGAGTQRSGSECIPNATTPGLSCGAGTTRSGAECRPNFAGLCGTDTQLGNNGTQCLGRLACGVGTTRSGDTCAASVTCGAGTQASGGQCVPSLQAICGAGTTPSGGQCVAGASGGSPTLAAFAASPSLNGAHKGPSSNSGSYTRKTFLTTFAQSQAEAWALSGAAPVGTGTAIQIGANSSNFSYGLANAGDFTTVAINPDTTTSVCPAFLSDLPPSSSNKARVLFVEWAGTSGTMKACAKGGSVRYERLASGNLKVTLNVEFNDGTLWQDKSFTVASVGGY